MRNTINPLIKVTVLMPVYNGEEYLHGCITSVLNQTYTDFEFLIIDDASTDNSLEIIRSFNDKRIRLVQNSKNLGQTKSLNIGIDLSVGDYIARIDQDDLYHRDKLLRQFQLAKNYNYNVIGTWAYGINEIDEIIYKMEHPETEKSIKESMIVRNPFSHSALFIEKKKLMEVKKYPENTQIAMDYHLLVLLALRGCTFVNIPDYLTSIRYHNQNSSSNQSFLLASELLSIQKLTINLVLRKDIILFKAVQFYRVIQLIRFLPTNFFEVIHLLIKEMKPSNLFYLIKITILTKIFGKEIIYPSGIEIITQV